MMNDNPQPGQGTPPINRYQVETLRAIAQQQIEAALTTLAAQLPGGTQHVQAALNAAGAMLDNLLRQTHQFDEAAQLEPTSPPNPDLAAHRDAIGHVGEGEEIHDVTSGA